MKAVIPNYNIQNAIEYMERWFDKWINGDEDWWGGTDTWDINVYTESESEYWENGLWVVSIYGLEQDKDGFIHTDTGTELDCFEFNLGEL